MIPGVVNALVVMAFIGSDATSSRYSRLPTRYTFPVIVATWRQLTHEPEQVVADLRSALEQ